MHLLTLSQRKITMAQLDGRVAGAADNGVQSLNPFPSIKDLNSKMNESKHQRGRGEEGRVRDRID